MKLSVLLTLLLPATVMLSIKLKEKILNSYLGYFLSVSDMVQATLLAYSFFIVKLVQAN